MGHFSPQSMVRLLERLEVRRGSDPGLDVCLVVLVSFCDGSSALVFHDILKSTASYLVKRPSTCVCLPFAYSWIEVELFWAGIPAVPRTRDPQCLRWAAWRLHADAVSFLVMLTLIIGRGWCLHCKITLFFSGSETTQISCFSPYFFDHQFLASSHGSWLQRLKYSSKVISHFAPTVLARSLIGRAEGSGTWLVRGDGNEITRPWDAPGLPSSAPKAAAGAGRVGHVAALTPTWPPAAA